MKRTIEVPPGFLPVWMDGGGVLVVPVSVYLAGLKLGKVLRRREVRARRETDQVSQAGSERELST